jgi:anti-sigma factor RsiW
MMHRLPEDQVEAFEEHYFACNNCATILQRVAAYVDAIRAAAQKLRLEARTRLQRDRFSRGRHLQESRKVYGGLPGRT